MHIKTLRGCGASGQSLIAGTVYAVPSEVSQADADLLIRLGKAIETAEPETETEAAPKPARRRGKEID